MLHFTALIRQRLVIGGSSSFPICSCIASGQEEVQGEDQAGVSRKYLIMFTLVAVFSAEHIRKGLIY
jgi:hypothetical protein